MKRYCYDCKWDVRGDDGIMIDCAHPDRQAAAHCCAWAAFCGERPMFEARDVAEDDLAGEEDA